VARAAYVIAVSTQTADDLMALFGTPARKISVVPNGVGAEFAPGDSAAVARVRAALNLPDRFFLFVGTLEPRKNLMRLVRAYARWRAQAAPADSDTKLVVAGGKGWFYAEIFAQVQALGLEDAVRFTGYVDAADLPALYQAALGFVYPSLLEGFGLPVLEAMACGAPVITSRAPSLMEVAGDAALCVEAADEDALAHALALLATQEGLRGELHRRGLVQAARYSWQRTAAETMQVYEKVGKA
jgi:glycosyltransferase involved in cell wall biosynthesis